MSVVLPNCPIGCATELPVVSFSDCAPDTNAAQIRFLYITNRGNPLTDWTQANEWESRISNSSTNANAIRRLRVVGDKPRPEAQEKKISGGRTIKGKKNHVVNFEIDETNNDNYALIRQLECGNSYSMWYGTESSLYGGNDGIVASISMDDVIDKDDQALELFVGDAKWSAQFHPERIDNPIAEA